MSKAQNTVQIRLDSIDDDGIATTYYPTESFPSTGYIGPTAWTINGEPFVSRAYFKFDLSSVPPGSTILSAKLSLFYAADNTMNSPDKGHSSLTSSNESAVYRVTGLWSEETINWINKPDIDNSTFAVLPESTNPFQDYTDIDVTDMVTTSWDNKGKDFSICAQLMNETYYALMVFATGEYADPSKRPLLEITYLQSSSAVSDNAVRANSINVYPNPVTGVLGLAGLESKYQSLEIVDFTGRVVYSETLEQAHALKVNVANLEPGIYVVNLFGIEGKVSKSFIHQ